VQATRVSVIAAITERASFAISEPTLQAACQTTSGQLGFACPRACARRRGRRRRASSSAHPRPIHPFATNGYGVGVSSSDVLMTQSSMAAVAHSHPSPFSCALALHWKMRARQMHSHQSSYALPQIDESWNPWRDSQVLSQSWTVSSQSTALMRRQVSAQPSGSTSSREMHAVPPSLGVAPPSEGASAVACPLSLLTGGSPTARPPQLSSDNAAKTKAPNAAERVRTVIHPMLAARAARG